MEKNFVEGAQYRMRNGQITAPLEFGDNWLTDGDKAWHQDGTELKGNENYNLTERVTVTPYQEAFPREMLVSRDGEHWAKRTVLAKLSGSHSKPFIAPISNSEEAFYQEGKDYLTDFFKYAKELPTEQEPKPLRRVEDLGPKDVIHCPTEVEAIAICKLMDAGGFTWNDGSSYLSDTKWIFYKEFTCYSRSRGRVGDASYYKKEGYTIHEATDFFTRQQEPLQVEAEPKVLICNNCKEFWIAPIPMCRSCECIDLSETNPSNGQFAKNREATPEETAAQPQTYVAGKVELEDGTQVNIERCAKNYDNDPYVLTDGDHHYWTIEGYFTPECKDHPQGIRRQITTATEAKEEVIDKVCYCINTRKSPPSSIINWHHEKEKAINNARANVAEGRAIVVYEVRPILLLEKEIVIKTTDL